MFSLASPFDVLTAENLGHSEILLHVESREKIKRETNWKRV